MRLVEWQDAAGTAVGAAARVGALGSLIGHVGPPPSLRRCHRVRGGVLPRRGSSRRRGRASSLRVRYRPPSPGPLLVVTVSAAITMAGHLAPVVDPQSATAGPGSPLIPEEPHWASAT